MIVIYNLIVNAFFQFSNLYVIPGRSMSPSFSNFMDYFANLLEKRYWISVLIRFADTLLSIISVCYEEALTLHVFVYCEEKFLCHKVTNNKKRLPSYISYR